MGEDEFEEMRKMINRMLADAVEGKMDTAPAHESFVNGFAGDVHARDATTPARRYLVPVPEEPGLPGPEVVSDAEHVYVTMDLRGGSPTSIRSRVAGRMLFLEVDGPVPLHRFVELPCDVEPTVAWSARDGILDVTLHRREGGRDSG